MTIIEEVERKLRIAIEKGLKKGYCLEQGDIFDSEKGCFCAIGSVVLDIATKPKTKPKYSLYVEAAKRLGITRLEVSYIAGGFDVYPNSINITYSDNAWDALGRRLRDDYYFSSWSKKK